MTHLLKKLHSFTSLKPLFQTLMINKTSFNLLACHSLQLTLLNKVCIPTLPCMFLAAECTENIQTSSVVSFLTIYETRLFQTAMNMCKLSTNLEYPYAYCHSLEVFQRNINGMVLAKSI